MATSKSNDDARNLSHRTSFSDANIAKDAGKPLMRDTQLVPQLVYSSQANAAPELNCTSEKRESSNDWSPLSTLMLVPRTAEAGSGEVEVMLNGVMSWRGAAVTIGFCLVLSSKSVKSSPLALKRASILNVTSPPILSIG